MKRADAAMYDAKASGNGLHVYEAGWTSPRRRNGWR